MDETLFTIQETPITLINLFTFVGVLILSFLVAKGIEKAARMSKKIRGSALYGLGRLAYYATLLVGFYIALTTIGIDLTGVAVVVGALSVGIGFGLQTIFNNFAAGIIVLLEQKIHLGDFIQLQSGDSGEVIEINVRTTVIQTLDGEKIVVPNTEVIAKKVIVSGKFHRLMIRFSVSRDVDKDTVRACAVESIQSKFKVDEKRPIDLWISKISDSAVEYELTVWSPLGQTRSRYIWEIENHFSSKNIKLSFA